MFAYDGGVALIKTTPQPGDMEVSLMVQESSLSHLQLCKHTKQPRYSLMLKTFAFCQSKKVILISHKKMQTKLKDEVALCQSVLKWY